MRLGEDAFPDGAIEVPHQDRVEKDTRVGGAEPTEVQLRDVRELLGCLAAGENKRNGVGAEAAGHERQGLRRLGVKPLDVVDDA